MMYGDDQDLYLLARMRAKSVAVPSVYDTMARVSHRWAQLDFLHGEDRPNASLSSWHSLDRYDLLIRVGRSGYDHFERSNGANDRHKDAEYRYAVPRALAQASLLDKGPWRWNNGHTAWYMRTPRRLEPEMRTDLVAEIRAMLAEVGVYSQCVQDRL